MAAITNQSSVTRMFETHEFFPLTDTFPDGEIVKITKRPRKSVTDIIDIYSNKTHIGMFVGIKKNINDLFLGLGDLNKSHQYRNILKYAFVKLLEYYGLNGIDTITIRKSEVPDFNEYLSNLGFILKQKIMILDLNEQNKNTLISSLQEDYPIISDRYGQLRNVILKNMASSNEKEAKDYVKGIVQKIKNKDKPEGLWDYRTMIKVKNYINVALLHKNKSVLHGHLASEKLFKEQIIDEEFHDFFLKNLISSFEPALRKAYLHEFINALAGKSIFPVPYIDEIVPKYRKLIGDEGIKNINVEKYEKWIDSHMAAWVIRKNIEKEKQAEFDEKSELKLTDFGVVIKDDYKKIIQGLLEHYRNERVYFGMKTTFKN